MATKDSTAKVVPFPSRVPSGEAPAKKARRSLTDAFLRAVKPPAEGRLEIRDSDVKGLTLRMTSSGTASWSVRVLGRDGKHQRPTLGTWPHLGIKDARTAALAVISAIQGGADPVAEKQAARAERQAKAAERSVTDRLTEWQEAKAADAKSPWSDRYATEVARIARRDIGPKLGKRPLTETTRADWTGLVATKRKTAPAMASAMFRVVASFLSYAEASGWITEPLLPRKGAATIAPSPAPRVRVLTDAELMEVWKAAGAEPPKLRAFIRLLVLTAAREVEVADIATGEIDREAGRWRVPGNRTKNGQPYTVPMCSLALAEIAPTWPEESGDRDDWRLLGKYTDKGFRGFSKLKSRLDETIAATRKKEVEEAGAEPVPMPPWRWHDLRRTARTGMTRLGIPRDHAEMAINHISARTTLERTYDRHDYTPEITVALGTWQAHVAALVKADMA